MSAKKRFLTLQYRMKRITAQEVANMIKIGSVTDEDIPDALKNEVEELMNAKSDSNEIIADEEKETVKDGNDN